jgi:AraC-like DNA-binding protein
MTVGSAQMTTGRTAASRMALPGTVSCTYFLGVLHFAAACGASRRAVLHALSLDERCLDDGDARLPLEKLRELFDVASRALDDPSFALGFGAGVPCSTLSLASALAAATPPERSEDPAAANPLTLGDALDGLNRYASLGVDFGELAPPIRFRFTPSPQGVWLEDLRPDRAHGCDFPALTESVFARFATGIRRRGGESIVRALAVTHVEPVSERHRRAYADVFRVPVSFNASRNALCLDPAFLERPLEPLPAPVETVLSRHADRQIAMLRRDRSWRARVMALLERSMPNAGESPHGLPDLSTVCAELAVSRHTLHRRLRAEGTTFAALHTDARRRMAEALLRDAQLPLSVVAHRVGFSEAAAFSRAYLRWTGRRPGAR